MTSTPGVKGRVLVLDDDGTTTETFAQILTLEGYEVRTAGTAEMALCEAAAWHADVFVLDLHMPFINGLGFLYRLRAKENYRDTPVALVTGDQCLEDSTIAEIAELGADLNFKPLWIEDLVCLVGRLIAASPEHQGPPGRSPARAASLTQ